jgi:hypothetical protein
MKSMKSWTSGMVWDTSASRSEPMMATYIFFAIRRAKTAGASILFAAPEKNSDK